MFAFTLPENLVSYYPAYKKLVILLSTLHKGDEIDNNTGNEYKPCMITFFKKQITECGFDVDDMQRDYMSEITCGQSLKPMATDNVLF